MMPCIQVSYLVIGHASKINRILKWPFNPVPLTLHSSQFTLCKERISVAQWVFNVRIIEIFANEKSNWDWFIYIFINPPNPEGCKFNFEKTISWPPDPYYIHLTIIIWISSPLTGIVFRIFMSDVFRLRIPFFGWMPYSGFLIITRSLELISATYAIPLFSIRVSNKGWFP